MPASILEVKRTGRQRVKPRLSNDIFSRKRNVSKLSDSPLTPRVYRSGCKSTAGNPSFIIHLIPAGTYQHSRHSSSGESCEVSYYIKWTTMEPTSRAGDIDDFTDTRILGYSDNPFFVFYVILFLTFLVYFLYLM